MVTITEDVDRAVAALRAGRLVAFPTETVYGLGADATSDAAVAAIFAAKGRPRFNPLIIHVADADAAAALGCMGAPARRLAEAFWPGPLTLVVPRAPHCPVSPLACAGLDTIALRVPSHPLALAMLRAFGRPVAAPSANVSGRLSPTEAEHVAEGPLADHVEVILDGGECPVGVESTIVGIVGQGPPRLLRPGGIPRAEIEEVLGEPLAEGATPAARGGSAGRPSAPGQLASHYAPRARLRLNAAAPRPGEMFLAFGPDAPHDVPGLNLSPSGDLVEAAANLYAYLHILDETGVDTIAVAPIPEEGLGEAINDRLRRAAAPRDR
ncbi:MAG TPA: threonylcarbamoyl-AMP synthase [Thermopetrobacter sp.]|nr:threonylcarbamoyl-AMP synthase [Thermopetrobacter sp.]